MSPEKRFYSIDWRGFMTDTQWFREAGFGLFIHWGLYALQGLGE